jgi:hypothetical protein
MRRSRPEKCMERAPLRARSRESEVKSAMEASRRAEEDSMGSVSLSSLEAGATDFVAGRAVEE